MITATNAQKSFIHALKTKLNLCDEHYRDMLAAFNVKSSSELSISGANEFLDALIRLARQKGISVENRSYQFRMAEVYDRLRKLGKRDGFASYGQLCKILALWREVSVQKTPLGKWEALNTFLKNKWGIERIEWLPVETVSKIIKTLQAMKGAKHV